MKTIIVDESLKGKELTSFLLENKKEMIAQKKAMPKHAVATTSMPTLFSIKGNEVVKADPGMIGLENMDSIRVKAVMNTAWWCDSQMDVLVSDCWAKTIVDRKGLIPHLHDHVYNVVDAEVGEVVSIYSQDISLTELGLNQAGKTQVLIFESDIKKSFNEKVFYKYRDGRIKQHSIGLWYVKMELAINDPDSEKEFDFWKKYYGNIINKDVVDERGFFWLIPEIKLIEGSAVLFGSNELTPTLGKSGTDDQPQQKFDVMKAIKETKFFNS